MSKFESTVRYIMESVKVYTMDWAFDGDFPSIPVKEVMTHARKLASKASPDTIDTFGGLFDALDDNDSTFVLHGEVEAKYTKELGQNGYWRVNIQGIEWLNEYLIEFDNKGARAVIEPGDIGQETYDEVVEDLKQIAEEYFLEIVRVHG